MSEEYNGLRYPGWAFNFVMNSFVVGEEYNVLRFPWLLIFISGW